MFPTCPRFTPLGRFENNRAHSAAFYGLRIFPMFLPSANPCNSRDRGNPIPAEFKNFEAYRCGMKGAMASIVSDCLLPPPDTGCVSAAA